MAFSYAITATSFALVCSLVWLLSGGSLISAMVLYVISGQVALVSLMARAALAYRRKALASRLS